MFSEEEDPSFIEEAVDAGVSAYLMGGFDAKRVKLLMSPSLNLNYFNHCVRP